VDGRTKKRPGQEEQAAIITRAAVDLFSKHGTKLVSIAQICTHADVSRPTFHRCFKDKDELIASIYLYSVNAHVEEILRHMQGQGRKDSQWCQEALGNLFDAIKKGLTEEARAEAKKAVWQLACRSLFAL